VAGVDFAFFVPFAAANLRPQADNYFGALLSCAEGTP
jgi:hypothetical protein